MRRILLLALLIATWLPQQATADAVCPGAQPIADARRLVIGSTVTVHGRVSVPTGAFTADQSFALQDASAGIYVYRTRGIGQALAAGDEACVTGRLTEYHGLLELLPASPSQITRLGAGAPPTPRLVSPNEIGETTEGLLVSVTGPASALGARRFRVGGAAVFIERQTGITLDDLTEGCPVTVTGLSADYDAAQIWPRSQADVVPGDCQPAACSDLTIAQIQGTGLASPYDGRTGLSCLTGCITGVAASGFYIQSAAPDDDPRTSEGAFVFRYSEWDNPHDLRPGNLVEIHNFAVQEYYGSTEIVGLTSDAVASYERIGTCELPTPLPIPPLTDPEVDPATVYEPYEGMRVELSFDGMVVGPTTRYVSRFPAGDPEIALVDRRSPLYGQRLFDDVPADRGTITLSGGLGQDLPDVGTGDRLSAEGLTGVLGYQFERYVLLVDTDAPAIDVVDAPDPVDPEAPIAADEFAVCSFNLENLFDALDDGDGDLGDWTPADAAGFARLIDKRAAAIREDLQRCPIIGVQEVEGKDAVWDALTAAIGGGFRYDYYESIDARDITVGLLYDEGRVTLRRSDQAQTCTPTDYDVDYAAAQGPRGRPNPCAAGSYPLFSRPPYVADLTVRNAAGDRALDVRVIVNHLKSKRGDETTNLPRRIAEARYVASLLTAPNAVALGDFNDTLGSATLAQFAGFADLYTRHIPPADRYSYIYNGRSEALDHFVMTPGLDRYFKAGGPVHIDADFPDRRPLDATSHRSSDHDPVFVRFSFQPTGISEALAGLVTGALGAWKR
ncbi:MAG: hypothetical protein CVU38_05355 [Chloroflexi bacterium HGW-Chloroflexi-1]|nr:MAG: hypothetical protein CVU38_05355 [Chloroflexi bacterium HGW-Chloroflexi-1]